MVEVSLPLPFVWLTYSGTTVDSEVIILSLTTYFKGSVKETLSKT